MASNRTSYLQGLLRRLKGNDQAVRNELIGSTYERMRLLARKIFHEDFPRLKDRHETDSVLNEAVLRLLSALEEVQPTTVREFFGLSALQIRRVLLDMARRREARAVGGGKVENASPAAGEPEDTASDPRSQAAWSEFHEQINALPPREREMFDLLWYQGLKQAEAAALLGVSERTIKMRWQAARLKLNAALKGEAPDV